MTGLAWRSLRHRLPSFSATFVAILLSTLVVGAFATLVETATGPVSGDDRETLIIMGAVIGGWGALIAMFSLVSTLSVAVRRRDVEIGLLRVIGATPRQARRMVRTETAVVALAAALTGAVVAWPAGRALLAMIRDGGLVAPSVEYGGGVAALGATMLVGDPDQPGRGRVRHPSGHPCLGPARPGRGGWCATAVALATDRAASC